MAAAWGMVGCLLILAAGWAARAEQVVISKIMYHPRPGKPEYIEVFNNTSNPFDIARWRLTGSARYEFADYAPRDPAASFLRPFERIVLSAGDEATTRAAYAVPSSVRVFGPWEGTLDSLEDRVTLKDKNGLTVCRVSFGRSGHWPVAADGTGHALVLLDPNRKVDDWRNWEASTRLEPAPGIAPAPARTSPMPSPEIEANLGRVLVDYGAVWRFRDSGANLGSAWREPAYDDRAWRSGPGLIGWDRKPLPKPGLRTRVNFGSQITYYFRRPFFYAGDGKPGDRLVLDQVLDDGAVYYLNGAEIGRTRMPPGPFHYRTLTTATVGDAVEELNEFTLDAARLQPGTNWLAAEVHQCKPTSSDIVFGARLRLAPKPQAGLVINELSGAGKDGFVEFCNTAIQPADLKGCFLSDAGEDLRKHCFPPSVAVPPGGLIAVGLADCGITNAGPLTVYLTAPDGRTVLSAATVNFAEDSRSAGRRPDGGGAWFRFAEPSRGLPNPAHDAVASPRLNELHFTQGTIDWIELFNPFDVPCPLHGLLLSSRPDFSDKVALAAAENGTAVLPPRSFRTWEARIPCGAAGARLFLANAEGTVLDSGHFAAPEQGDSLQATPDGGGEWRAGAQATRNAPNLTPQPAAVVISEIMYDPPAPAEGTEFVELFNRGIAPVDLSGWRFNEGISFVFPAGAKISPQGCLVVAANAARLKSVHSDLPVVGDYRGRLRHDGERLQLVDAAGNLVNQVDFRWGGDWPVLAHGGGSSMELVHPWMDNTRGSAWRDSEESGKGSLADLRVHQCLPGITSLRARPPITAKFSSTSSDTATWPCATLASGKTAPITSTMRSACRPRAPARAAGWPKAPIGPAS